ncbi:hypothetical protein FSARC_8514 [Fusarium sarcochroum]|uniref:Amino acid permease/ SLC12A domain-containing protein n=1 Tax=Fusarium sarcochroum TaxID=1208366 RepID=A0A8H4TSW9_9HYPO|nr:hypothetical protein FSARC_8514 [Fusarium sarcochroum]
MVGGNPQHDAYGFRHWNNPGAFAEYISTGSKGRWEGFLGALWIASFAITGPEYVAMASGEAKNPRKTLKTAFKWTYFRFFFFFVGTALCTSILVPYDDPILKAVVTGESDVGAASASPYIIAMQNMGIGIFPHIATVLLVTTIFSAGNAYTYCATRTLYSLSLDGQAPKFFQKTTKAGVPLYCLLLTMVFPLLSFLTVSNGTATVITWLVNLVTAAQVLDYVIICITYLRFYKACKAQNLDRRSLPYYGWGQPYCAWVALVFMTALVCGYGYEVFLPGHWDLGSFFTYYTMLLLAPVLYIGWKVTKKTKIVKPELADLIWDAPIIDALEAETMDEERKGSLWKDLRSRFQSR